jgi:23S rRNA pseudouridine1911/1915/1917 synthase
MKHLGHPLFHDLEYGGDSILKGTTSSSYIKFIENCFSEIEGQALHAKSLGFLHPKTLKFMNFESDLPIGFKKIIDKWSTYTAQK